MIKMNAEVKEFTIEFIEPMLGTIPKDPNVVAAYIANLAPTIAETAEEIATAQGEKESRAWTGFHADDTGLFVYNYMIKGQIKMAIESLIENKAIKKKIPAYKKWIDRFLHIYPRRVYFGPEKAREADSYIERPLRAMTARGERITVTRSDIMEPGRTLSFEAKLFKNSKGLTMDTVEAALMFGEFVGLGQWRGSGGYGRFVVK